MKKTTRKAQPKTSRRKAAAPPKKIPARVTPVAVRRNAHRILLDRTGLTAPRSIGSEVFLDLADHVFVTRHTPEHFHVNVTLERDGPYLWTGIDPNPHDFAAERHCFAVIGGETLRAMAEAIIRYYPGSKGGGR